MSETVQQHFERAHSLIVRSLRANQAAMSADDLVEMSVEFFRMGFPGVAHALMSHFMDVRSDSMEATPNGHAVYEFKDDPNYMLVPRAFFDSTTDFVLEAFRRTFASPEHSSSYPSELTSGTNDEQRHMLIDILILAYSSESGGVPIEPTGEAVH